jgi:hypothetical protein
MEPMAHSWNQFLGHKFRGVELVRLRFVIYREETKRMVFHDNYRQFFHETTQAFGRSRLAGPGIDITLHVDIQWAP